MGKARLTCKDWVGAGGDRNMFGERIMESFRNVGLVGHSSGAPAPPKRRWRRLAWVSTVVMAMSLGTASVAGFAAAAGADPPSPDPGIAPGAANASGTNYVFYTATGGAVQMKSLATGGLYASAGGHLVSAPSAIVTAVGHDGLAAFVVFGQGTDNALWYTTCTASSPTVSSCSGLWTSLGGVLSSKPGAVAVSGDTYSVYVRGSDGAAWGRDHSSAGWGAWYRTGGALLSGTGPSADYDAGRYVLVVGTNRQLYIQHVGVTGFTAAGGVTDSSPALVDTTSGLVGFVRGTNNALRYHQFLQSTPGWHSVGGVLTTAIGGSAFGATPYAYALGTDSQVWQHTDLASGSWSNVTP